MRKLLLIGIGAGHTDQLTVQAIKALNSVDVFFTLEKGAEKDDLLRMRRQICEAHIRDRAYRTVAVRDPERDRAPSSYESAVEEWHRQRAAIFEKMLAEELGEGECGAFLVWGDPSLYDSTLRIVQQISARGIVEFTYQVIPGISSVQALAAAHKISLNHIGGAVHITTGRNLRAGFPENVDNCVVMLDADCAFKAVNGDGMEIYWGAYIGTKDEILVSGDLASVAGDIERMRAAARARMGWIMDIYLLRRRRAD
jgi:precorrin-6A synthase